MKTLRRFALILALTLALCTSALAAPSIDFDGTVVGKNAVLVTAPIGGRAESVPLSAGEKVSAGDPLVTLRTTKVYAPQSGTVTGLFAEEGDSITAVEARYGAVLYIEPAGKYTIAATTEKAYDSASTKYIHVGETVYLACTSDAEHRGEGIVTAVSGTGYTVEATSGSFYMGETVNVFRSSSRRAASRLGRGDIARIENVAVTGTGSIARLYVKNGDEIQRGDLLFETLTGEFDAYYNTGSQILSPVTGILAEVKVAQGDEVAKDAIVASVYPEDGMQIEMDVPEADLGDIAPGTPVSISFNWSEDDDDAAAYSGVIASVSHIAKTSEEESDAHFTACVDFTPGEEVRVGMTVVVTLVGVQADESAEPGEDDEALEGYAGEEEPTEDAEDTDNADAAEKPVFGARGDRGGAAKPDGE